MIILCLNILVGLFQRKRKRRNVVEELPRFVSYERMLDEKIRSHNEGLFEGIVYTSIVIGVIILAGLYTIGLIG